MRSMSVAGSDPVIRRCLINVRFAPQADLSTITDGGCRKSPAPRRAVLVGDRAEAVVLDLVQPLFRWRAALTPFSAPVPYDVIDTAGLFEAAQVSRCWRRRARLDWHTTRRHCSAHTWALRLR